ncbi:MAG: GNAT family N-acetyltransferase [Gemmatimonadetes bacterium]|jgi:ribosomal protein S18 acetylase RimI-like enzyme|nr:GNAT family N-acetyltransferase [Gemmatimonadota bacterium]
MGAVDINIRAFEPVDWDAICAVYESASMVELALSGADAEAFRPMPEEEPRTRFLEMNSALLACLDGKVVGFVAWRDRGSWHNSGYLSWLYVEPAHHRRGIGDQLLQRAMTSLGPEAWTLTKLGNDPAISLYQKHGMAIVKTRAAGSGVYAHTELRLALPTSRKFDPEAPNFGA